MILSDESTLFQSVPSEKVFDSLKLIVNCHEDSCDKSKYRIGACKSANPPAIVTKAVHNFAFKKDEEYC